MFHQFIVTIFFSALACGFGDWGVKADTCSKPGIQCSADCNNIIYCAGSSGEPIVLEDCSAHGNDSICTQDDSNNFVCAEGAVCSGDEDNFPVTCGGGGHFPAAYNCSLSYFCLKSNEKPKYKCVCPPGSHFESGTCTTIGYESCCEDPAARAQCNHIGEFGTFGNCHPGYYYICGLADDEHIVANVLRCELGEVFVNGSCQATKDNSNDKNKFAPKIDFLSCDSY